MIKTKYLIAVVLLAACGSVKKQPVQQDVYNEPHRPQIHFSPKTAWMNDPNGMVFYNGTYQLFYQYHPNSTVWGPMHWGHATSTDLVHWQHQPIALYPDSIGTIFSGSAVADVGNTSGFGTNGQVPLVAIFTSHDTIGEKRGRNDFQTQSIAYSLDAGKTWTKYAGNPVLKNPGIRDFRDPKVMWHEEMKKWIMTLAVQDHVAFYSSPNLKDWTEESMFGKDAGAHGGVWECPDLFPLEYQGEKVWVLLVSINPGGPNGGSATQYFTGTFDGHSFTPYATDTHWIDYGPDNYAGITYANTGVRKIFLGWMSNWQYAQRVPTEKWRSALTIPRDLSLEKSGDSFWVRSVPVPELNGITAPPTVLENIYATNYNLTGKVGKLTGPARVTLTSDVVQPFTFTLSNNAGENLVIGYDGNNNTYFIDRSASGNTGFEKGFAARHTAPRLTENKNLELTLIIDKASVELFADGGLSVMTAIFFPSTPYTDVTLQATDGLKLRRLEYSKMKSMYETAATPLIRR